MNTTAESNASPTSSPGSPPFWSPPSGVSPGFGFRVSLFRGAWVSGFAHFAAGFRSGFGFRLGGYPRFARPLSLRQYNLDLRAIVRLRTAVPVISTNMHINTSPVCIVGPSLTSRLHCRTVCIVGPSALTLSISDPRLHCQTISYLPSALLDRLHCRTICPPVCIVGPSALSGRRRRPTAAAIPQRAPRSGWRLRCVASRRAPRSTSASGAPPRTEVLELRKEYLKYVAEHGARRAACAPDHSRYAVTALCPPPCAGEQPDSEDEAISSLGSGPNAGAAASDDVIDVDEADVDEADEEEEAATDSDDSDDGGNGASIASARRSAARVARSEPTAAAPQVYQAPPQ